MESGKIISCVFFVVAAFFAIKGLPKVSDTDRYYRAPGQIEQVSGTWSSGQRFNEVSLDAGQTIQLLLQARQATTMTGLSFSQNNRNCVWILTQKTPSNLNVDLQPRNGAWCWEGTYSSALVTNEGAPQVIRYTVRSGRGAQGFTQISRCRSCGELPLFEEISDYNAIRRSGLVSLGTSGVFVFFGWIAWIGIPTAMGYLYVIGRAAMPSLRAKVVRQEFERAKATGETFDTRKTYNYDKPAESAFRRQQDIDDMNDLTASFKRETERLRAMEAKMRASKQTNQEEYARLVREYEEAVERVNELQKNAARAEQGEA